MSDCTHACVTRAAAVPVRAKLFGNQSHMTKSILQQRIWKYFSSLRKILVHALIFIVEHNRLAQFDVHYTSDGNNVLPTDVRQIAK